MTGKMQIYRMIAIAFVSASIRIISEQYIRIHKYSSHVLIFWAKQLIYLFIASESYALFIGKTFLHVRRTGGASYRLFVRSTLHTWQDCSAY